MPKMPGPYSIAAMVVLNFAVMVNSNATIKALEQEEKVLDSKIFEMMKRTYLKLYTEKKLKGYLIKEYKSIYGDSLASHHQS